MVNDIAVVADIQQTINSHGYQHIKRIGDEMIVALKDQAIESDDDKARQDARGAARFWRSFVAKIQSAANTQIEAETEISPLV